MRFLDKFMKCVQVLVVTCILYCIIGNAFGYALFRTVFSGVGYDAALPLSILVSFVLTLTLVIVFFRWLWKRQSSKKNGN